MGAAVGDVLHPVEDVFRDERLVASPKLLALVGDPPRVVVIPDDYGQAVRRDAALRVLGVAHHPQAPLVELIGQVGEGVLAGGVQLEGGADERAAYWVDDDGPDPAVLDVLDCVEVADRSAGDRAAVLGLLPHLVLDVLGALVGDVLVDYGEKAVEHPSSRGVVDVLLDGGDQLDAELLQSRHHDRVIQPVPGEPTQHVDDDVAHVGVFAQVGDHRLELRALVDGPGGAPGVHELGGLGGAKLAASLLNLLALGGE
nr:hypothetical protein [Streptomyces shenzhenensis]